MDRIKAQLMDVSALERTLDRMAHQIAEAIEPGEAFSRLALIGMQTRGVHLARRLRERIRREDDVELPLGILDSTMYRDDFRMRASQPTVRVTDVPFDVTDRHIVLVDDVIHTGRTARAALDALMDLGRPASVRFLAIIDRGERELPICADIIGRQVPTLPDEEVRVRLSEIDDEEGVWLVQLGSSTASSEDNTRHAQR